MKTLVLAVALFVAGSASGQNASEDFGADTDPTKPVLFSIRDEHYDLLGGAWQNVALLRLDRATLQRAKLPGQIKGIILRADIPIATFSDGHESTSGLGDVYVQAIAAPHIAGPHFLAFGTGLLMPTASEPVLGRGRWIAAPALIPVRVLRGKGFAFVKFQDWWGFAGESDRPAVHYFTVTPLLLRRISKLWWTSIDTESNTNWEHNGATSYKAGLLFGRMLSPRTGVSLKVEVPYGEGQTSNWTVKAVIFRTRF
jgi:hypothetical protein